MDIIKTEVDRKFTLCQGCLSSDRKVSRIGGPSSALFFDLIGDQKHNINNARAILLCWECKALLQRLLLFQRRIQNAQYVLVGYLQSFCHEGLPTTLSTLQRHTPKEYDVNINDEQKNHFELPEQQNNLENQTLNVTYKEESIENIKEEAHYVDNIEADYYDTDYKYDVKAVKTLKKLKKTYPSIIQYVTVRKLQNIDYTDTNKYFEKVCLSEKEIEDVIEQRERKKRSAKKMRHKCKICGVRYLKRIDMLRHKTFHHTNSPPPYTCQSCSAVLQTESDLSVHWSSEHTAMMRCTLCTEMCRNSEIAKHLKKFHTKMFICNMCDGNFCTLREFNNHYNEIHGQFTCDYCGRRVRKKQTLENHIRRNHLPPYCGECKRRYSSYHVLETHTRLYHPQLLRRGAGAGDTRRELAYCVECDKQFPSVDQYKKHLRQSAKHTPRKTLRIPCPDCGKVFSRTNYMNNHYKLIHMKSTKYFCAACNKFFVTGYALRKHTQHVHQKVQLPKDKICDLCGRGFSTNRILANHRRTHTGERPFKCKYCPATFAQQTAMNTHQKTQHKNIMNMELAT